MRWAARQRPRWDFVFRAATRRYGALDCSARRAHRDLRTSTQRPDEEQKEIAMRSLRLR